MLIIILDAIVTATKRSMRHSVSMSCTVNISVFEFLNCCRFFVQFLKSLKDFYHANHPRYDNLLSSNSSSHQVAGLGERRLQNMTFNTSVFEILCFFAQFLSSLIFCLPNAQDNHFSSYQIHHSDTKLSNEHLPAHFYYQKGTTKRDLNLKN